MTRLIPVALAYVLTAAAPAHAAPPAPAPTPPRCEGIEAWQVPLTQRHAGLDALLEAEFGADATWEAPRARARAALCASPEANATTCAGGLFRTLSDGIAYGVALPDPARRGGFVVHPEACWGTSEPGYTVDCETLARRGPLLLVGERPTTETHRLYDAATGRLLLATRARIHLLPDDRHVIVEGCGAWTPDALRAGAQPDPRLTTWRGAEAKLVQRGRAATAAGDYPGAISLFSEAIRLAPGAARAWSGRGYARYRAGQHREAITDFAKARQLDPSDAFAGTVLYNTGLCHEALGDAVEAAAAFEEAALLGHQGAARRLMPH